MDRACIHCNETLPTGYRCPHCHRASTITTCPHRPAIPAWRVVDNRGALQWVVIGDVPALYIGDEQTAPTLLGRCRVCRALFVLPAGEARRLPPRITRIPYHEA